MSVDWKLGTDLFSVETIVVEPDFQSVASVHDQFAPLERLIPRSATDQVVERKTELFFDPTGGLLGREVNSSSVVDYLGKRKVGLTFLKKGQIGLVPVTFQIRGEEITSIGEPEKLAKDPKTGAYLLRDQQGVNVHLQHQNEKSSWSLEGQNTSFMGGQDYLHSLRARSQYDWNSLKLINQLERIWRLRASGIDNKEGATTKLTSSVFGSLGKIQYLLAFDLREGSYDENILEPISDQVVAPYSYLGLNAYLEHSSDFSLKNRQGKLTVAGELIKRETDLLGAKTGNSLVGYFDLKLPLGSKWDYKTTNIFVDGPAIDLLPSGRLRDLAHNELVYHHSQTSQVRFGYSIIDQEHRNAFVSMDLGLGQGKLSLSLGRGIAPIFKEGFNLPGTLARQDFYHPDYLPSQVLANRPWQIWDQNNFYALWQNQLRSTEDAWAGYMRVSYLYSF